MAMDIMGKVKKLISTLEYYISVKNGFALMLTVGFFPIASAKVFEATLAPYIAISQIYSDNLTYGYPSASLQQNTPQGGFVTEITPGLSVIRKGSRSDFNLHYRLQTLNYEGVSINNKLFNQLQMTSKTEIIDDSLFIDSTSTISQANLSSTGGFSPDNIGRAVNTGYTTYRTLRISPYWQVHYNGLVEGEVRISYYNFGNSGSAGSNGSQPISAVNLNSNSYQQSINLKNGKRITGFGWRLGLNNQEQYNQGASTAILANSTIRFRAANGEVSYRLGVYDLNAFVQAGYYDNSYPGISTTHNGAYLTPGLSWIPSPKFQLAVGYGYNAYFTNLTWHPSQRTTMQFNYRNSQVGGSNTGGIYGFGGLLTGSGAGAGFDLSTSSASGGAMGSTIGGTTFNSIVKHQTRTTSWTSSYITTTGTVQQLLTNLSTFSTPTDLTGSPIGETTANNRVTYLPNLNNDVIISKKASISLSWFTSKTNITIFGFHNNISYELGSSRPQDIYGFNAVWNWRFAKKMSASLQGSWQVSQYSNGSLLTSNNGSTQFVTGSLIITRQVSSFITAYLQYSYYHSNNDNLNNTGNSLSNLGNYDANRVTASLNVRF
jgi:hypothetical protein